MTNCCFCCSAHWLWSGVTPPLAERSGTAGELVSHGGDAGLPEPLAGRAPGWSGAFSERASHPDGCSTLDERFSQKRKLNVLSRETLYLDRVDVNAPRSPCLESDWRLELLRARAREPGGEESRWAQVPRSGQLRRAGVRAAP